MRGNTTAFDLKTGIIHTLNYFQLFHYPLKEEEIHRYISFRTDIKNLRMGIQSLLAEGKLKQDGDLFALINSEDNFERRRKSNMLAEKLLPKAYKVGRFLARFPFVRFVGISGSLSKLYADKKTDFDFFIVCAENRLWIARTLMHLFKKLSFLLNKQKYFCMNYYLTEDHLKIQDSNKYTAIELATLIPVFNQEIYLNLLEKNDWAHHFVPNFKVYRKAKYSYSMGRIKSSMEFLFKLFNPDTLNKSLMHLTEAKWKAKWKKFGYSEEDYELAFRTKIYVSKNHPKNYQKQVLKNENLSFSAE